MHLGFTASKSDDNTVKFVVLIIQAIKLNFTNQLQVSIVRVIYSTPRVNLELEYQACIYNKSIVISFSNDPFRRHNVALAAAYRMAAVWQLSI